MPVAIGARACGTRLRGGVYLTVAESPDGQPLEFFLADPPRPVDAAALGLSAIGVKLVKRARSDTWDVWDIVGRESYPNVADVLEEGRRMGFSRRIPHTADFGRLTAGSRLVLLHARAVVDNIHLYTGDWQGYGQTGRPCPRHRPAHADPADLPETCCGVWWQDLEGGVGESGRAVIRELPVGGYYGFRRPEGVVPSYRLGIVATLPLGGIDVIRDPATGSHAERAEKARAARGVRVEVVDG